MTLVKWNPSRDLLNIERDFNRLFKSFNERFGTRRKLEDDYENASWAPLADIIEKEDFYLLKADIPGLTKDDVKVSYTNGVLSISGERKEENESKDSNYYKIERSYGKFFRSFTLPEGIDENNINAEFKDGTLSIKVPKSEKAKPKQIEVKIK
ncbi:MAG: heat-shock protein [Ignavibacteriae bacterium HGW-Ignavibacteriae-2]|jgi:HSP20 family protein|nr:Hsp20/alpha crystallin family protein [Bacteroidota bacterium]PKL87713.1 MAG: heat-shock protein [Ignavibacteriae bacterium HGW-Ignavibacteriae-2]